MSKLSEIFLKVFSNRSEYHSNTGIQEFPEGPISLDAKRRLKKIRETLETGYLDNIINSIKTGEVIADKDKISEKTMGCFDKLVESLTSEVGRALIGLTIMQLTVKSISPSQSIRLHKGSSSAGSFSWKEGISMRTLDKNFVTPSLRRHRLLRLNADGFMMTRSLAENYPYTELYKANLRGARLEWLNIVDEIESGSTDPLEGLKYILAKLVNSAEEFESLATELVNKIYNSPSKYDTKEKVVRLLEKHQNESDYAARLLEISMHSLLYTAVKTGAYGVVAVKPLSQMRSANKKHGNIGDIELCEGNDIIEAWDAKYGKAYLREEIEEIVEKIKYHENVKVIGFVSSATLTSTKEINKRISEIEQLYNIKLSIMPLEDWVTKIFSDCNVFINENNLSINWLQTYTNYICQKKRDIAPIDEPCYEWVKLLSELFDKI